MCSSSLPFAEQLRMPCLSSCARKELHTRAGGATSAGSLWAAEIMLLRSLTKLWRPLRAPKCVGAVSCCGGRPSCCGATCVFLCCMVFPSIGEAPVLLPIDSESLRRIFRQGAELFHPLLANWLIGFRPRQQPRSYGTSSWRHHRFQLGVPPQLPWRETSSLLGTSRGCRPPHSPLCPTN